MKIKKDFKLREFEDVYVIVATGKEAKEFNGLITINNTGAFLWKLLKEEVDEKEMLKAVLEEYDIDEDTAKKDIDAFITKIKEAGLVE